MAALPASFEFCDRAYSAATDTTIHAESRFGPATITRALALPRRLNMNPAGGVLLNI